MVCASLTLGVATASEVPACSASPHAAQGAEAARRALHVEGDVRVRTAPLVAELVTTANVAAGPRGGWLGELMRERWPEAELVRLGPGERPPAPDERRLVVVVQGGARHTWQQEIAGAPDAVVVEAGMPAWRPERPAGFVATHGAGRASLEAALDRLAGRSAAG